MSELKKCAACRKESNFSDMKVCMHNQMHYYVCDSKCMDDFYNPPKQPKKDYDALQSLNAELLDVLGKIKMRLEAYLDDDRDMAKSSMWLCLDYAEKAIAKARSQS